MELVTEEGRIFFDEATNTMSFSGRLRSTDPALFEKLSNLLRAAHASNPSSIRWDMRALRDINSAGLGVLYQFVSKRRHQPDFKIAIRANSKIYWQERYLPNIKKIIPHMQLEFFQIQ